MEFLFFGAFSVLAAIIWGFAYPKIAAMSWAQTQSAKGYVGMTLVTASAFFVVLIAAASIMSLVGKRSLAEPPTLV